MTEDSEYRMALGKRADDLGRILAFVGEQYELREAGSPPSAEPEFISPDLAGIDQFLTNLEQRG